MTVAVKLERRILKMPEGTTFKYQELSINQEEYPAATKAIERLIKKGLISRASTGVFYKPRQTVFGSLKPKEEELLRPFLFNGNRRIAYITGTSLYNRMKLTTQVPKNIKLATRDKRIVTKVGNIQVSSVKSYADVTNDNYALMELLDVLKDFKIIPDTNKTQTINILLQSIKKLSNKDKEKLIKLAIKYPPRVRALLGALLNKLNPEETFIQLKKSINPLTYFVFGITKEQLSTIENWNIR